MVEWTEQAETKGMLVVMGAISPETAPEEQKEIMCFRNSTTASLEVTF